MPATANEDEADATAFAQRTSDVRLYDEEQRLVREAIDEGRVPAAGVALGTGIERLCIAASDIRDITRFLQSSQY